MSWHHPDLPFAPRRWPFFYGWVIVGVGTLGVVSSMPGQTNGIGPFIDELMAGSGLSRLQLSLCYLFGTGLSALLLPAAGTAIDRYGCRRMLVASCAALALVLVLMSRIDHFGLWLGARTGLPLTGAMTAMILGFVLLRFSGQGVMTVVSRTMIAQWFDRRRGLAAAISGTALASAFSFAPLAFYALIGAATWRGALLILAAIIGLGMGLIAWIFARDNPEECGLLPDGGPPAPGDDDTAPAVVVVNDYEACRGEALKTSGFWAVTLILTTHSCFFTAFAFHIIGLGAEAGLEAAAATALFAPMALLSPGVGLVVGVLCDRVRISRILLATVAAQILAFAGAFHLAHPLGRWLAIVGLSISAGCFGPLSGVALPRFFGRRHLGGINGAMMTGVVLGSALGPLLLAIAQGVHGRLGSGFGWALVWTTLTAALALIARNPQDAWHATGPPNP